MAFNFYGPGSTYDDPYLRQPLTVSAGGVTPAPPRSFRRYDPVYDDYYNSNPEALFQQFTSAISPANSPFEAYVEKAYPRLYAGWLQRSEADPSRTWNQDLGDGVEGQLRREFAMLSPAQRGEDPRRFWGGWLGRTNGPF